MIATPAPKLALLHGARFQSHGRLLIEGPDGDLRDYSNQGGVDWFEGIEWGKTVDNRIAEGTVELRREAGGLSLSPMLDGSVLNRTAGGVIAPALDMNRRVEYWEQVTEPGAPPVEADWVRTFDGRAQKVSWAGPVLQLPVMDRAIELVQRILRTARTYGSESGVPVQTVMQALLDDTFGAGAWPLYVPVDPGFSVTAYTPSKVSVWEALEELSKQFAGYVEYRASDGLTLVVPDRADLTPVATIGPGEYKAIPALDVDLARIRTVIEVTYKNKATGKVETVEARAPQPTIDAYGDQYLGVTEADTSVIDTGPEAQAMANGIRDDLATPRAVQQVVNWAWYPVELGDVITWEANGVHYDTDQTWAVTGFRHRRSRTQRETTFDVRGAITGGYKRWLQLGKNQVPAVDKDELRIHNFRVLREDDDTITLGWSLGARLEESWYATRLVDASYSTDVWTELSGEVQPLPDGVTEVTVAKPPEGKIRLVQVEGRYEASAGVWKAGGLWRREVYPRVRVPALDPDTGELADAAVKRAEQVADGVLTARTMTESARRFSTSVAFSAPDHETVAWTAGVVTLADGTTYHVDSGTTGAMTAPTYIYLDPSLSTTALRVTTNVAEAVGERRLLLCYARPIADATQQAMYVPAVGLLGLNSETLNVNSVNALHIASISLAVLQAQVNQLSALTADLGEVNTGIINNAAEAPTRGIRLGEENALPATWVDFLDLAATGTDPVLKVGGMQVLADGTTVVLDSVLKTLRISHHGFRPSDDTTQYSAAINNTNLASGTGTSGDFFAPLPIPAGVVITGIRFRGARGDAANTCQAVLYRQNADDTNTALATATVSTNADQTALGTVFPSELVSEDVTYLIEVFLSYAAGAAPGFRWVEVQYTSPNYRATY